MGNENMFRVLNAEEIECRVGATKPGGFSMLLYKDARVDRNILDETVGPMNWANNHEIIDGQLFASVSLWNNEQKVWVTKQDVGTESMTEKEKGRASDSFKRACFKWGVGVELYSAPFIWISVEMVKNSKGKLVPPYKNFYVSEIDYDDKRKIKKLTIIADGKKIFSFGDKSKKAEPKEEKKVDSKEIEQAKNELSKLADVFFEGDKKSIKSFYAKRKITRDSDLETLKKAIKDLNEDSELSQMTEEQALLEDIENIMGV